MDAYVVLKVAHVLGVVLFVGNIIVTAVWKGMADRTGRPEVVGFAQRLVTLTDWVFTLPGVLLVLFAGLAMAHVGGLSTSETPWIWHGLVLFTVSGLIWAGVLIPLQIVQGKAARAFEHGGVIPERYWRLNRQWFIWGIAATVLPVINIAIMVVK
ncbi:MAG: hypothetical protein B7Y80_06310 [Hyphomicrobium sp. 32-62-53]|nr:MAG: hypothetical protein B7Z29_12040 [Hyphomicrobium sp. 12-62-95]OYY00834.1 MAG: hypothetical protein B7Y80_06310 [Hyphomicrobium sp. 32-62-53]